MGNGDLRIMLRHLLPNAIAPIIVQATLDVANVIVLESTLSFLGFGIQPPTASWGNMLANAEANLDSRLGGRPSSRASASWSPFSPSTTSATASRRARPEHALEYKLLEFAAPGTPRGACCPCARVAELVDALA